MAYNSTSAPGVYGYPPGAAPPGMVGPPGSSVAPGSLLPPGMAPPGMAPPAHGLPARPVGLPPNFTPLQNMPNFNPNAPVIRMGTGGPPRDVSSGGRHRDGNAESMGNRRGLGMDRNVDQQRQQVRENMMAFHPPTREEIARTIFVGNITEGLGGNTGVERILGAVGGLRRWTRAIDADNKPMTFGFAEFEDAQSLKTAAEVLANVRVPLNKPAQKAKSEDDAGAGAEEDETNLELDVKETTLQVVVDEASKKYADDWGARHGDSDDTIQFRYDSAKELLGQVIASLFKPDEFPEHNREGETMQAGAVQMADPETGEFIMIPMNGEDELSDIPAESRELVAAEIAAFRERSIRRDIERVKREDELEARERANSKLAPNGPSGTTNNIPLGPRDRGVQGAPSGPKVRQQGGLHGAQIPKDYQNGVNFVNGNNAALSNYISKEEEEDSDASDDSLERKRREKKAAELEKFYLDYERRWLNRERGRAAAIEREKTRDDKEAADLAKDRGVLLTRLKEWDDDVESAKKTEEYYSDRSLWLRNRALFRAREQEQDERDRAKENRAQASIDQARGMADSFLDRQAEELSARASQAPQPRFKISLGAAMHKANEAAAPKARTMLDVESMLDNEEEIAEVSTKRTLIPISFDMAAEGATLTDEERDEAVKRLASSLPIDRDELFKFDVRWEFLDDKTIDDKLLPVAERKILDYLGVQEDMLVDVIKESFKSKTKPEALVSELEVVLEDEAEGLVKKLWRMLAFLTESERLGLVKSS